MLLEKMFSMKNKKYLLAREMTTKNKHPNFFQPAVEIFGENK